MGSKNPGWQVETQKKHRWKEQIASVWVVVLFIIWVKVKFSLVRPPSLLKASRFFCETRWTAAAHEWQGMFVQLLLGDVVWRS